MATDTTTTTPTTKPPTARARARAELIREIKAVARRQMAEQGAAALSLRAVSRELGMVSSAIYRYFPSRDELLTALIVDAYDAVADAAEASQASTARAGTATRWVALADGIRAWAHANRADFDLVYGSPVPGYQAPTDTIVPAQRVSLAFIGIVVDGFANGEIVVDAVTPVPRPVHADFATLREFAGSEVPDQVLSRGLLVWTLLFGTLSFELHGHLHNVIHDYDAFFDLQMRRAAHVLLAGG